VTTHLPERLRDLADDAPGPLSPAGLWQTGRRRHRRRVVTAVAMVGAVVALTAGTGYGDHRSRQPDPAAPPATQAGPMAIPVTFFQPSPWLPSTQRPGRLVAIMPGVEQKHVVGGATLGVVGVAAGSQRYAFLDLPDRLADDDDVVLSPDGLRLAYWLRGSTNAVGVLDLTSGRLERHPVLVGKPLANRWLTWTSDVTLALEANWARGHAIPHRDLGLTVGSHEVRRLPLNSVASAALPGYSSGSWLSLGVTGRSVVVRDPATGAPRRVIDVSPAIQDSATLNDGGTWLAGITHHGVLAVGRVRDGRVRLRPLMTMEGGWEAALRWSDDRHVMAEPTLGRPASYHQLVSVEVGGSARTHLLSWVHGDVDVP
jgi:hypothetical protein